MHRYILTIPVRKLIFLTGQVAFVLVLTASLIGWPLLALSAYNTVTFDNNTDIYFSGSGYTITVQSGSTCAEMEVSTTGVTFTLETGSTVTVRSTERRHLGSGTDCSRGDYSEVVFTSAGTAGVTPTSTMCGSPSGGGGGGGGGGGAPSNVPTVSVPTTTTGSVTATASGGGQTTLTTADKTTAQVILPANAVSASTDVKVAAESTTTVTVSRPTPSGKNVVGNYVYNYTATSAGKTVSTFSKEVTVTITYTNEQVTGLKESSLKIYYWDGTQWLALTSTVDTTNNKVSANTNHFTYFIVMGEAETPPEAERAKPEDYGLKEGNLIRAVGDFDIFIINEHGYKRLFLNPAIFEMYGHLGSWDDVISVAPSTRDAFITSSHYRYVDEDKVYHLEVTGEDTGTLQWINMTGEDFLAQGGESLAIFTINKSELDWYPKGEDKTSL